MIAWLLAGASVLLMAGGCAFMFAAALGVLRFPDALQRMHASTKAGTVGAILAISALVLAHNRLDSAIVGALAILFLLTTAPIAAHLLGRAIYVSGARLMDLHDRDALDGHLPRRDDALEDLSANMAVRNGDRLQ